MTDLNADLNAGYVYRVHCWWKLQVVRVTNLAATILLVFAGGVMGVSAFLGAFTVPVGLFAVIAVLLSVAGALDRASVPAPERVETS